MHRLGVLLVAALAVTGAGLVNVSAANAAPEIEAIPPAVAPAGGDALAPGAPALAADAVPAVATTTVASLLMTPSVYGEPLAITATVTPDGSSLLMGAPIQLEVDGVTIGQGNLFYIGEGKFWALIPGNSIVSAGTHQVVAKFPGYSDGIPFTPDALPSQSAPMTITVAAATTTTTITSSPASTTAFTPIDVAASVTGSPAGLSGSASLLADGAVVATEELASDGTTLFDDVIVPFGTTRLSVSYLGDNEGNYAISESSAAAIEVVEAATDTTLSLSRSRVHVGDPVTFIATVRNISEANLVDPRSGIEILVDGEVVYTEVSADEGDTSPGDGTTQFEVTLSDTLLGAHTATARFLPVPGFTASESEPVELQIDGIDTVLTPSEFELRGTLKQPAAVTVNAAKVSAAGVAVEQASAQTRDAALLEAASAPVDGYVQAFLGDKPIGEPILVEEGTGTGPLAGLPLGTHEVELRFTPGAYGLFSSSATVSVTVAADAVPGGGGSPAVPAGKLATTGDDLAPTIALTGIALMLSAGLLLTLAKRRRNA